MTSATMKTPIRSLTACLMALALVMAVPAVVAEDEEPPEDAYPFEPCGAGAVRNAIALVDNTAPLDLGQCEEFGGDWYFVPGEDTQPIFEQVPDVGGPPGVPGVPTPMDLPPHLNCDKREDWMGWMNQTLADANCSGYGNIDELTNGCDPLDPTSHPGAPDRCNLLPPDDSDEFESWVAKNLPTTLNCAGHESADGLVAQLSNDADCNGYGNVDELSQGCNPLNPTSTPAFLLTCAPEPDIGDPEETGNQTTLWAQMQAAWGQGAVLGALPIWLAGIIIWLLGEAPEVPE